jgi:hypothetical protein
MYMYIYMYVYLFIFMYIYVCRLLYRPKDVAAIRVLVVTPTRELATQIFMVLQKLSQFTDITSCLICGGKKVYLYIFIYMFIYVYIYIYIYMYIYVQIFVYIYIYIYI